MECIVQTHSKLSVFEGIYSHLSFTPQNNGPPTSTSTSTSTSTPTPTAAAAAAAASLPCDDFFVDELLNLNNHEDDVSENHDHKFDLLLQQFQPHPPDTLPPPPLDSVLSVPEEEEADLEWLSHFVEESFTQFSTPYPAALAKPKPTWSSFVTAKARRSKRTRTGGRLWSAWVSGPEFKKLKKRENRPFVDGSDLGSPRRCSHCGVQKTPQWRAGPMGPKTLCNACGVRYKSGRLLPEYRPACSPTFSSELHSNSHRKVLEMRKQKEVVVVPGRTESETLSNPVSSFG